MRVKKIKEKNKISGKRKITLITGILLTGLFLSFVISGFGFCEVRMNTGIIRKSSFGQPQLSGFKFRKRLYISNSSKENLFNYQIVISAGQSTNTFAPGTQVSCENNIKADFADIRFTCADGETILPYYLEGITGESPDKIALFWVKVPQIPFTGLPIYMYYGNPQAQSKSCGKDVFDFFEDFARDELDPEIWEVHPELGGSYKLSDSRLKLKGVGITSRTYQFKDGIIEYRANAEALLDSESLTRQAGFENRLIIRADKSGLKQVAYSSAYEGAEHCLAIGDIVMKNQSKPILSGASYRYEVKAQGNNLTFKRYSILDTQYSIPDAEVNYIDKGGLKQGRIGLSVGQGDTTYYDWLRVRKFTEPEPKIVSSEKAELTNLPYFLGSTLSENGDLILTKENTNGIYISETIPIPFEARIIVPTWTITDYRLWTTDYGLSIDLSANAGANYKTDCKSGSYYYASRGDFTPGSSLRYRLMCRPKPVNAYPPASPGADNARYNAKIGIQELSVNYYPGNILLVSPNGGETWKAGTRQKILWLASGYESAYPMRIEYSPDGGKTYNTIKTRRKNTGVYFWNIPRGLSGKKLIIKVSDALDRNIYDVSDGMVEIR